MDDTDSLVVTLLRELDEITVADRIRQATDLRLQTKIDTELIGRVAHYLNAPDPLLQAYLTDLEREWSIERVLALQSSATAVAAILLGALGRRRWYVLALVTSGFLLQHSLQGWCPPVELHRRLGCRTQREIDLEIHMLKLLRGDYAELNGAAAAAAVP